MSCYHPLKAFKLGLKDNGKMNLKVCSYDADYVVRTDRGSFIPHHGDVSYAVGQETYTEFIEIPCGQCVGCRLSYSRDWANRCILELGYHESSYFVTLTYDNDHVPMVHYGDPATGEVHDEMRSMTLDKRDWQLFMKKLRKRVCNDKLRFFMAGEYGDSSYRPHFHAIIFGLKLDDLKLYKQSDLDFSYYTSLTLTKCWSKGIVVVANVSWETCAYTARYVMKKLKGDEAVFYDDFNMQPPFTLMSRKPGIGRFYYEDNKERVNGYDYINVKLPDRGLKFRPPRYFSKLYDVEYPDESMRSREHRMRCAKAQSELKLSNTSKGYLDMLEDEEYNKSMKLKGLMRKEL